jgi:hypothetical protein
MYLNWTFAGTGCASAANVATVTVDIPNTTPILPTNVFSCAVGDARVSPPNYLQITNFSPGSYVVNLTAKSVSGTVLFTGTATVVVNGDVYQTIDTQPVGNTALLSWTFAPAVGTYVPPCTNASDTNPDRIDSVALYVDGASSAAQTYDCSQGTNGAQVSIPALSAGSHTLQLVAYQAGIADPFAQSTPVSVSFSGSGPSAQTLTLNWLVGGIGVAWTYPSSNVCSSGGVASVTVTFTGPGGYALSGNLCNAPVVPFERLPAVTASGADGVSYKLNVSALNAPPASLIVYSGSVSVVTIQPGRFYDGTTATLVTVPLLAVP